MILPQFKDYPGKCRRNGPLCKKCRAKGPKHADWREAQTGMREFACPFEQQSKTQGNPDATASPPKKKRSVQLVVLPSPAEIDKRVGEPCKVRTAEGTCQICACKTKDKACRAVVAAGMCRLMGVIAER